MSEKIKEKINNFFSSNKKSETQNYLSEVDKNFESEILEKFKSRRSIRKYSSDKVEWNKIFNILEGAVNAPCAGNVQNYKIIVIQDKEKKEKIAKIVSQQYWIADAPYLIAIVKNDLRLLELYPEKGENYSIKNCAALAQNILNLSHLFGLGACWIDTFENKILNEILEVPEGREVDSLITIGFAIESPSVEKNPMSEIVRFEKFGNRKQY